MHSQKQYQLFADTHPLLHELWVPDAVAENGTHLLLAPAGILQHPESPQQHQ
jgi:hypothetical protein